MNERILAFSDGVFAIAITVLILEIKVPPLETVKSVSALWSDIARLWPSFFALSLSFVIILISWVGHHNNLRTMDKTSTQFQFANGFFLFTVMITPFPTAFMAEYLNTPYAQPAIVVYCLNAILHNLGWNVLLNAMIKPKPLVKNAAALESVKANLKGSKKGFFIYLGITILAWWFPYVALVLSLLIWIYWLYLSISVHHENQPA